MLEENALDMNELTQVKNLTTVNTVRRRFQEVQIAKFTNDITQVKNLTSVDTAGRALLCPINAHIMSDVLTPAKNLSSVDTVIKG